jgi:hypothetical protein
MGEIPDTIAISGSSLVMFSVMGELVSYLVK